MSAFIRRPTAWLALALVAAANGLAQQPPVATPADLVATRPGTFPVILSAPHGGTLAVPGVPARKGEGLEKGPRGFVTGRDSGTEELAHAIADAVEKKTGQRPYLVVAKFARKYVDANRPPEIAYEHPLARPTYDHYRGTLAKYCQEVKAKYGKGLLLDVHGQGSRADTVFRGTQNGTTVALLRQRYGEKAHAGPQSFFGLLAANGATVHPADGASPEQAGFTGGHITRTYGGGDYGIDAIQLEFGSEYRSTKEKRSAAAAKVAATIDAFAKLYLLDK